MLRKTCLVAGIWFLLLGILDFLCNPAINVDKRQLKTYISSHRGYGTHYVTILVGSPPQSLRLAVATGSDYTAFPCQGCSSCHDPQFHFSVETLHRCPSDCLYKESKCLDGDNSDQGGCHVTVSISADDDLHAGGYKGIEVTDSAYLDVPSDFVNSHPNLAKKEAFPLHFVCQEQAIGSAALSNGYLGMSTSPFSFVNQLKDADKINQRMFSLCFRDYDDYKDAGASAGHVTFGQVDRDLLDSPLVWARNTGNPDMLSNYAIHIRRIYLGIGGSPNFLKSAAMGTMSIKPLEGTSHASDANWAGYSNMNGESGAVLIESNQPTSYFDSNIEDAFKDAFHSITGMQYTVPAFPMTEKQFSKLPTIFIQLEAHMSSQGSLITASLIPGFAGHLDPQHPYDVILAVPPEHYIVLLDGMAFPSLRFGKTPRIASNLLQKHELVFDLDHNRIGIAERLDCPEGLTVMNSLHIKKTRSARGKKAKSLANEMNNEGDNLNGSVEGVESGEFSSNGTVLTPEDRNFIVVGTDSSHHAASTGSGNGLNSELELKQTSDSSKHKNNKGRMIDGSNEVPSASPEVEHPGKLVEPQDGLPKPDAPTSSETSGTRQGTKTSKQSADSTDSGKDPYNWLDVIGLGLFLMGFSLTLCFTQDSISENWLYKYLTKSPDQIDDIGDDAELAKAAWSKGKSFYHKSQKSVVGRPRTRRQASFSTARTSQSEESSQKTGSSGRPYYDASKSSIPPSSGSGSKSFNENFYQAYSVPLSDEATSTARSFHDSFGQSSRSFYSEDSFADVRKTPYGGLARDNSATSFNSDSMDDLQYPTKQKANFPMVRKPFNNSYRSASDRSGFSQGYDRPQGDEYYRYGDDDDYTRGDGIYYDDRTKDDGTYYDDRATDDGTFDDSPQYASFESRGQESFMSRGDERPVHESFASHGGNIYDRYGDASTRGPGSLKPSDIYSAAGSSQAPYSQEKPQFDSDNYSDVESFYADEASLPRQNAKGIRYHQPS